MSFTVTTNRPDLFAVAPSVDAAGTLRFTPAPNANGQAAIQVIARDDGGTDQGGINVSSPHDVAVTVAPVNDPVVAVDDSVNVDEDDPAGVTISVLSNDLDADADTLTVMSTDTSAVSNGTVTGLSGGRFHYLPAGNFFGTESFSYVVSDGRGSLATAQVQIVVNPTPDAPIATDDAYVTGESTPLSRPAPGVLGNDFDEDGDAIVVTTTPVAGPEQWHGPLGSVRRVHVHPHQWLRRDGLVRVRDQRQQRTGRHGYRRAHGRLRRHGRRVSFWERPTRAARGTW